MAFNRMLRLNRAGPKQNERNGQPSCRMLSFKSCWRCFQLPSQTIAKQLGQYQTGKNIKNVPKSVKQVGRT
eukprot:229001-Amphidinium_carterae.1